MPTAQSELTTRRVPVVTAVTCDTGAGHPSRILSMLDLSEGGFFVQTAFPLSIGARLHCRFHLGDQPEPLQVLAEVAWVRPGPADMVPPPGMGLRFLRLPHAVQDRIRRVIDAHNAQIQYYQQHQRLSEDAMLLSVPRVQLLVDGATTSTRLESWNGRSLVVTMALPFEPGQEVRTSDDEGRIAEQGRISWIQFVPQGREGPELELGVELQMHTWGQEAACRRATGELPVGEEDEEWDYEILQSVPAAFTLAPTLPIPEPGDEEAPFLLLRRTPEPPRHPEPTPTRQASTPLVPAPALCEPTSALSEPALALSGPPPAPPEPAPAPPAGWAPRLPSPPLATDTYPVALGVSSGGWPLNARATAIVFGIVLGGLGLTGLLVSGRPEAARERGVQPSRGLREFTGEIKQTWAYTPKHQGHPVPSQPSSSSGSRLSEAPAAPVDPAPITASTGPTPTPEPPLAAVPAPSTAPPPSPGSAHSKEPAEPRAVPVQFASRGSVSRLVLELEGPPASRNHYALADPTGVVIDLEGTRILQKSGFLGGDGKRIRRLKVVPMSGKSRLIVYTQSLPGRVQLESQGNRLTVSLHFADTVARHP